MSSVPATNQFFLAMNFAQRTGTSHNSKLLSRVYTAQTRRSKLRLWQVTAKGETTKGKKG